MAVDFQVVFPQTVAALNNVRVLPGVAPTTLDVLGDDFSSVDSVAINQMLSPDVVILSKTRLLAQVPAQLSRSVITSVTVTTHSLTISPRSVIKFQIGQSASKVSGILRLIQVFLKILLTTPGTDIFAPRIGGGALKNLGLSFGKDQGGAVVSDLIVAVNTTTRQITTIQARDPTIPRDERLLSAQVTAANFNRAEAALVVSIEVTSQAGRSATANLFV